MNPAEILAISQLASLAAQGITSLISARKTLATNASQTEVDNLNQAHTNFQQVIDTAMAAIASVQNPAASGNA